MNLFPNWKQACVKNGFSIINLLNFKMAAISKSRVEKNTKIISSYIYKTNHMYTICLANLQKRSVFVFTPYRHKHTRTHSGLKREDNTKSYTLLVSYTSP